MASNAYAAHVHQGACSVSAISYRNVRDVSSFKRKQRYPLPRMARPVGAQSADLAARPTQLAFLQRPAGTTPAAMHESVRALPKRVDFSLAERVG